MGSLTEKLIALTQIVWICTISSTRTQHSAYIIEYFSWNLSVGIQQKCHFSEDVDKNRGCPKDVCEGMDALLYPAALHSSPVFAMEPKNIPQGINCNMYSLI